MTFRDGAILLAVCLYWTSVLAFVGLALAWVSTLFTYREGDHYTLTSKGDRIFNDWARKPIVRAMFGTYLAAGFLMSLTFKAMVPATSWLGVAYLTTIWPAWQLQDLTGLQPPIPDWVFSFST